MKTLETERLILRKFRYDDFDAVHSYAKVAENIPYMLWGPNTEADTKAFINRTIAQSEDNSGHAYPYAVILKETNQLIGACELILHNDEWEIGWILHRDYWKHGFGPEMGRALLDLGFDELNIHRIVARCDVENYGSWRVMEKLGMRREGVFIKNRPANKLSTAQYSDELLYAILEEEWEVQKEIAYYNSLPCDFKEFADLPALTNGDIELICINKCPAIPEKKYVPAYIFEIRKCGQRIGELGLRIGYTAGLYYGGQIGYLIDAPYRGNGYAGSACLLAAKVAKSHDMKKLLITNDVENTASRRVCEKLGLRHIRTSQLPEWTELYQEGQRHVNIYELEIQ